MTRSFTLTFLMAALGLTTMQAGQRTEIQLRQIAYKTLAKHTPTATNSQSATSSTTIMMRKLVTRNAFSVYGATGYGFVVVSHDDRFTAILGESGHDYDANNLPCGLKWWMNAMDASLTKITDTYYSETTAFEYQPKQDYGPLLKTDWGQETPFNQYCPIINDTTSYTGCIATSAAQVMYYFKYPKTLVQGRCKIGIRDGSTRGMPVSYEWRTFNTTFDWDNMKDSYNGEYTTDEGKAVANLMSTTGIAVHMVYGSTHPKSGGSTSDIYWQASALADYFEYDSLSVLPMIRAYNSDDGWMQAIEDELAQNRPVLYVGYDSISGHSFIIDGMRQEDGRVHVNWGWDGYKNDYYNINYLYIDKTNDFRYNQMMLVGIDPNSTYDKNYNTTTNQPTHSSYLCINRWDWYIDNSSGRPYVWIDKIVNYNWRYFYGKVNLIVKNEQGETVRDTTFFATSENKLFPPCTQYNGGFFYFVPTNENWPVGKYNIYFVAYPDEAPTTVNPVYTKDIGWVYSTLTIKEDRYGRKVYSFTDDGTTAVQDVEAAVVNDLTADGEIRYFNLAGRQIAGPQPGINIVKQGNATRKIMVK